MTRKRTNTQSLLFSNKKGNALILGIVFLVIVGFIYLLVSIGTQHFLLSEVNNMVQDDSGFSTAAKNVSQELTSANNGAWDNAFAFLVGGVFLGMFVAGFTLQNNPLILGAVFLLLILGTYAGFHIVNIYEDINAETTDTLAFEVNFPKAHYVMSNLVVIIITGLTLLGLGIFTSNRIGL